MAGIGARLHAHRQAVRDRSDLDSVPVAPGTCWAEGDPAALSN